MANSELQRAKAEVERGTMYLRENLPKQYEMEDDIEATEALVAFIEGGVTVLFSIAESLDGIRKSLRKIANNQ